MTAPGETRSDTPLVAAHEFFRRGEASAEGWSMLIAKGRGCAAASCAPTGTRRSS